MHVPPTSPRHSAKRVFPYYLAFAALLALVVGPRFVAVRLPWLQRTGLFVGYCPDSPYYAGIVQHFRGGPDADGWTRSPFIYRLLASLLAAPIPATPLVALNLINVVALAIGVLASDRLLVARGGPGRARVAGALLWIVSFPSFYYATIGCVDAPAVGMISLGVLALLTDSWRALAAVAFLGALTKEGTILIIVAALAREWRARRSLRPAFTAVAAYLAGLLLARNWQDTRSYLWWPQWWRVVESGTRLRSYLAILLTAGAPAALALRRVRHDGPGVLGADGHAMLAGIAGSAVLTAYSLVGAHMDGRTIWLAYPFLIAFALLPATQPLSARPQSLRDRENAATAPAKGPSTAHSST